jgi:hypothetical protein
LKKSSNANSIKDTTKLSGRENTNSSSAKVINEVKGEDEIQNQTASTFGFIDEFLEDAIQVLISMTNKELITKCGIPTIMCLQVLV